MDQDYASKKEFYFHPLKDLKEREEFYRALFTAKTSLRVKQRGHPNQDQLTFINVRSLNKNQLVAFHIGGPLMDETGAEVTVSFETGPDRFYSTGELTAVSGFDYVIEFKKIFKMYSRALRVPLSQSHQPAEFKVISLGDIPSKRHFKVLNISAGGLALEAEEDSTSLFSEGLHIKGNLIIGGASPIVLDLVLKHIRRQIFLDSTVLCRLGCEFQKVEGPLHVQLKSLVNHCMRLTKT